MDDFEDLEEQLKARELDETGVLGELESVTQRCAHALVNSRNSHEQLLARYFALKGTVDACPSVDEKKQDPGGRRPYVLVLIDAHSHKLHDDYVGNGHEGGVNVAAILQWEIRERLGDIETGDSPLRIVVRMMASFKKLASDFHPSKSMSTNNMRALQLFAGGLSADTWTDFVDVHHEDVVGRKIVDLLKWHVEDPQCLRVFFGAVGRREYCEVLRELRPLNKITLVQGSFADDFITSLGMATVTLPIVNPAHKADTSVTKVVTPFPNGVGHAVAIVTLCHLLAVFSHISSHTDTNGKSSGYFENSRYISHGSLDEDTNTTEVPQSSVPGLGTPSKLVPLNAGGHRLDESISQPTTAQWAAYKLRAGKKKVCTTFHLGGYCSMGIAKCHYDHNPLSRGALHALRVVMIECPCQFKGACRRANCFNGHTCQDPKCARKKTGKCRFSQAAHDIDTKVIQWVEPRAKEDGEESSAEASSSADTTVRRSEPVTAPARISQVPKTENIDMNRTRKESQKASMENWPSNFGVLIDL